ncbi:MAG TPA: efflux RND transporter periplasmic adaptor subunit [Vicinamibacterales bacterium]|nr:efflux RND transporter periplasmic adaptor subunit [Vicinamibacterales bacterium]
MNRRTLLVALVVVAIVSVAGVARRRRDGGPALPTAMVTKGTFIDYLQLRGEIRPIRSVTLTAPSSGSDLQIVELATNGAPVKTGDVVVQFDTTVQQRTLEQKQSELKQAESEIQKAEAELRRREQAARTDLEQARGATERARIDLAKQEILSPRDGKKLAIVLANAEQKVKELAGKMQAERTSAEADVTIARQKRDKARFDVADTERIIAGMTIRAPSAGSINVLPNYRASAMYSNSAPEFRPGDRAYFGAPIAELPDLSTVQLSCHFDEEDRARVQTGRAVLVRVDAIPNHELKGEVSDISMMAKPDFRSWPPTRNFDVIVTLKDTDANLRPGMSAGARVELEHLPGVLLVPSGAIFQRGRAFTAYVVDGSSIDVRTVTVLRRGRDQIAIAAGLREGERVSTKDPEAEAQTK